MKSLNLTYPNGKEILISLALIFIFFACGESKQDESLIKAFELHNESMEVRKSTEEKISVLLANQDSAFTAKHSATLDSLNSALAAWDEQVIEVPGFEHSHNDHHHDHSGHEHDHEGHDHDHSHSHGDEPDLTPKQHLDVQQHLLDEIKALEKAIGDIKE